MAAKRWWNIELRAPLWLAVSVVLLILGLFVVDPHEAKGRAALIGVGAFGVLCSLTTILVARARSRRDAQ